METALIVVVVADVVPGAGPPGKMLKLCGVNVKVWSVPAVTVAPTGAR